MSSAATTNDARSVEQPAPRDARGGTRNAWFAAGIVVATIVAYWPALNSGYIWDDNQYVHENALVKGGWAELLRIWMPRETPQYYPLVFTSFWLEDKLWGTRYAAGFHLVNVLLHAANALLVWRVARRLGLPGAVLIGAVFALHPVHVESVAWITERKNVLSGLFYLLALLAYLRFDETRRWMWYAGCCALFLAALLSKTVTASLPAVLLLILFYRGRLMWRTAASVVPLLVVGAGFGLLTAYLEQAHVGASGAEWNYGIATRAAVIAPSAFLFYAAKLVWPDPLIFIYPRWSPEAAAWTAYVPLAVVLAIFVAAAVAARRFGRGPLLLLCFSAGTLFPALGFLNVFPHRYSFVADHFNYLGSLGFIALYIGAAASAFEAIARLGRGGARSLGTRVTSIVFAAGLLIGCGVLTFRQGFDYRDLMTLWERTLAKNPEAWIAQVNLGEQHRLRCNAAVERGRRLRAEAERSAATGEAAAARRASAEAERLDAEARAHEQQATALFERALRYPIARGTALYNLGVMAAAREDAATAVGYLRSAVREIAADDPKLWIGLAHLGALLRTAGELDEARDVLLRAVALAPGQADPAYTLALVYVAREEFDRAAEFACRAADLDRANAQYAETAGDVLMRIGRFAEAGRRYREILAIDARRLPAYHGAAEAALKLADCATALEMIERGRRLAPDDRLLLFQFIWIRAACPAAEFRNGAEAVALAQHLCDTAGLSVDTTDALAAAYAEAGDFGRAAEWADAAVKGARQRGDTEAAARIEARLALYREGRAYRLRGRE